jgi:hypothetical protein
MGTYWENMNRSRENQINKEMWNSILMEIFAISWRIIQNRLKRKEGGEDINIRSHWEPK